MHVPEDFDSRLDTPLLHLMLPPRLEVHFEEHGIRSVRDIVRRLPQELERVPFVGRRTVVDAQAVIERHLGMSWEEAHDTIISDAEGPPAPSLEARWLAIVATLPSALFDRSVHGALPPVIARKMALEGVARLGDLVALPFDRLRERLAVVDPTLRKIMESLFVATRVTNAPKPAVNLSEHSDWVSLVRAALEAIPEGRREIVAQRVGLDVPRRTLAKVGEPLGLDAERVRKIEVEGLGAIRRTGPWIAPLAARLSDLVASGTTSARRLELRDRFFAGASERSGAFMFFVNRILRGRVRAVAGADDVLLLG